MVMVNIIYFAGITSKYVRRFERKLLMMVLKHKNEIIWSKKDKSFVALLKCSVEYAKNKQSS